MAFVVCLHLCLLLPFLLRLPIYTIADTYSNVTLGSSLSALNNNNNSLCESPSGDFAFGFRQIGSSGFLLAIWFNKIPEKTVVWSANRFTLVEEGSKVELTNDGRLVLNDPQGREIWNAELRDSGVTYAAMLDTGNLVLAISDSQNSWESFDKPTDTILPTQILKQDSLLVSRQSEMNYSRGTFLFGLQKDGNLVLYQTAWLIITFSNAYWASNTDTGFQLVFNSSGYIYLKESNGRLIEITSANNTFSTRNFYQRAILDYDGVFRHTVYPKNSSSSDGRWSTVSNIPEDICWRSRGGGDIGGGACGFNSYCRIGEDKRAICECPPGYSYLDPNSSMKGCKQDFVSQSCEGGVQESALFYMGQLPNTDWQSSDFEWFKSDEDLCGKVCLEDCFCHIAIFRDGDCWKKKLPLSNGRINSSVGGKALIKIRRDDSSLQSTCTTPKKDQHTLKVFGSLLGSSVFLNFLLLLAATLFFFNPYHKRSQTLQPYPVMLGINLRSFTYKELEEATNGFKEELGVGAFATVYKGTLAMEDGNVIAVKKLEKMVREGEQEFITEVRAIGRTNHKNLVQLLGFCDEGQHRLLVYEFMSNSSLANFLFAATRPNWSRRMQIAFGIARGLIYLHEECSTQIIHCDIKPQNILLDDSFRARISDFGLAKLLKADQSRTTTGIRGTKGYVAPEWFKNIAITVKVDVYSFGIVLLEIICCRRNVEREPEDENKAILTDWAYDCYRERRLDMLVENDEEALDDMRRLEELVMIAFWCIQEDPSRRPTMKKVSQMLEGAVEVSVPPDPSSFISSIV